MRTLLDLFPRMERLGRREAIRWTNGYRRRQWSYARLVERSRSTAAELARRGVRPGDRVAIWGENRPEWVAAFWGCLLAGGQAVPVDAASSAGFARRIVAETGARLVLLGDDVRAPGTDLGETMRLAGIDALPSRPAPEAAVEPEDIAQIVYTSGSTSEPKGVVHRHRHICANLSGVAAEIDRWAWLARPFQPIRCLDLLPLSHLFGQTMGLYIPPLLGGAAVFTPLQDGPALVETIRRERVSVATAVPAQLAGLRERIARELGGVDPSPLRRKGAGAVAEAFWRHRHIHSLTGWKFWAFVVGGARLDQNLETFWTRLGYGVVQGYGLTEASPVVALNHPFSARKGSIGRALPGQEIRLAEDGEILVRGPSVADEYFGGGRGDEGSTYFAGGWLHTGDLGEMDAEGRLYYRGRKRDLIVRPDGLNVFPGDVERVLLAQPEIADCAVVGTAQGLVHAALVLAEGSTGEDAARAVGRANQALEPHQRVQERSLWAADELPRTPSTLKIRRSELARLVAERQGAEPPRRRSEIETLLGRDLPEAADAARLDEDLGLGSLERVELLGRVEAAAGAPVDDERFSRAATVADLRALMHGSGQSAAAEPAASPRLTEPRWTRSWPVRALRRAAFAAAILPIFRRYIRLDIEGIEHLAGLRGPVIFAANHASHLDTLAVYAALPAEWRFRLAPAMSQDYFAGLFAPGRAPLGGRLKSAGAYLSALTLFNAYPLPQKMAGARRALRYTGELADAGYSPLVFPEGTRTPDGGLLPFQPGVGMMAQRLGLPVVAVRLRGLFDLYSANDSWPRAGSASIRFGEPLRPLPGESYAETADRVRQAVIAL